ncbi:hypothetical protein COB11_04310 [Candidatus Aerophobetes bacterium]|uniref:valine--tRNA ligase n=1 Tax=Aerophobetes bacterium TaxID=2030807 RepID=A0A2A4YIJ0_UNCAE|nr:MAG: hypothetical protein COB11_04310 [Candidatus Aerophobetes bacterium]
MADPESEKPPYCIILPLPNVTGVLHMGHALVDTVQDALIRYKRMSGFEALWLPGLDHAGISTQTVVERNLIATTGKRRTDFTREEFLKHVWDWKELNETRIIEQLKKVGCSCDWSKQRFTMDEASNRAVRKIFKKMYDQNLIYRGNYLVNWDPVQRKNSNSARQLLQGVLLKNSTSTFYSSFFLTLSGSLALESFYE